MSRGCEGPGRDAGADLDAVLRVAYPRALATLVRVAGSLERAEDWLQEAAARAVVHWPERGVPESPAAWLVRTARNHGIDRHRRRALERRYVETALEEARPSSPPAEAVGLRDDMLRLLFICCHPLLSREAQVALTLKAVAGLTVEEIARAFLVAPRTIEQRITRAKRRIREADVPYATPARDELPERLAAVLAVVHLIFSEGHAASREGPVLRRSLCRLAIGQAHLLCRLFPGEPEVEGLLALLLLTDARSPGRMRPDGVPIPLELQDRGLWLRPAIREGEALLHAALRRGVPGPYQIQAAISACHCRASRFEETDWPEIVRLYDALEVVASSPVVRLNRAAALGFAAGPEAGIAELEALAGEPALTDGLALVAVRAGLLERAGRFYEARADFAEAAERARNAGERRYFEERMRHLAEKCGWAVG